MPSGNDQSFERTFADLAYTRLRDKAPMLLDSLIGFQLIDKNEDETRAVGVFGFKLGDETLYAPMFFLNGELKGHELLYLKGRDAFIPLKENWVNYILNRRPFVLGDPEEKKYMELGIRNPDLGTYKKPMADEKVASWKGALVSTLDSLDLSKSPMDGITVTNLIKRSGAKAAEVLLQTMTDDPDFADAVLKFYSPSDIADAVREAPAKIEKYASKQLYIVDSISDSSVQFMSDAEKETLLKEGYVVYDSRPEAKKTQVRLTKWADALSTPDSDGFYEVVLADGTKKVMLVSSGGGSGQLKWLQSSGSNRDTCCDRDTILIDVKNKSAYSGIRQAILTSKRLEKTFEQEELKGLSKPDGLSIGDCVVFVNGNCRTTAPFHIEEKYDTAEGGVEYKVCCWASAVKDICGAAPSSRVHRAKHPRVNEFADNDDVSFYDRIRRVCVTGKEGNKPTIMGETLFIPNGVKAIVLKEEPEDLRLPDSAETILNFFKKAEAGSCDTLEARKIGTQYMLKLGNKRSHPITKTAAIKFMMYHLGMSQDHAEVVVADAGTSTTAGPQYMLKFAIDDLTQSQSTQSPYFPEPIPSYMQYSGVPTYEPWAHQEQLGQQMMSGNKETFYTNDPYLDSETRNLASDAASKGQKEVLDTAVIGGLVKLTDTDIRVDEYVSDLMTALDRVGRILFMYYWHNDKFKERYGGQDMLELEDNLRNNFNALGDLTLFLKQKTISAGGSEDGQLDLGSVLA